MSLRPKNLFFQAKIAKFNLFFSKFTINSDHNGPNGGRIWIREVKFIWKTCVKVAVIGVIGQMHVLGGVKSELFYEKMKTFSQSLIGVNYTIPFKIMMTLLSQLALPQRSMLDKDYFSQKCSQI